MNDTDQYVYDITLEGFEEEIGNANRCVWHGRVVFEPDLEPELYTQHHGAIVEDRGDGYVDIYYCTTSNELWSRWERIVEYHLNRGCCGED